MKTGIKEQIVNELHKPARKNYVRRKVVLKGLNDLYQIDLVEMIPYAKENRGFKYILVVIDAFSKFVWALPVKNKSGKEVTGTIKKILKKPHIPKNIQSDNGKEFYNREFRDLMQQLKINHYSTYSNVKASIVERVNRTLKSLMWKAFSLQGSYKWLSLLPKIVYKYNNTKHLTIGMKPSVVSTKNEQDILNSVYSSIKIAPFKTKFKVNDYVRISKYRSAFDKGYTPNWTNEVFIVKAVQHTNPTTYLLQDQQGQDVFGGFYDYELQIAKYPNVHLVEKIIRKKGNMMLVKWLGFDDSHNSWIKKTSIV